jgi:hypothetical protein
MHLEGVIDHEGALGQLDRAGRIDHRAGAFPPGAVDHGDDAIVGMEVRTAEAIRLELVDVDVQRAGLLGVAIEHRPVGRDLVGRIGPHELIGRLEDDGLGIELGRLGRGREAQGRGTDGECKTQAGEAVGHFRLPDIRRAGTNVPRSHACRFGSGRRQRVRRTPDRGFARGRERIHSRPRRAKLWLKISTVRLT